MRSFPQNNSSLTINEGAPKTLVPKLKCVVAIPKVHQDIGNQVRYDRSYLVFQSGIIEKIEEKKVDHIATSSNNEELRGLSQA